LYSFTTGFYEIPEARERRARDGRVTR
jgi:hypothetical protein